MVPSRRILFGLGSVVLAACNQAPGTSTASSLTTPLRTVSYTLPDISPEKLTKTQNVDRAFTAFQEVNSGSNFTMPMGNNFTMPMGNNFTMPMGNNFTMPMGNNLTGARRVLAAVALDAEKDRFGFLPFPSDLEMDATLPANGLPVAGTPHVARLTGTGFEADKTLSRIIGDDETYRDELEYRTASVGLGSSSVAVTGTHSLEWAGEGWIAGQTALPSVILGVHASPSRSLRKTERTVLNQGGSTVVDVTVDQSAFAAYKVPFLQDQREVQLPGRVAVTGSLSQPGAQGKTLAFDLAAGTDLVKKVLTIGGWLKNCPAGSGCTPTAADNQTGTPGEIRETLEFDLQGAQSQLTFLQVPAAGDYGFKVVMRYDYAALLARNLPGTSELTGEVVLVDDQGAPVPGGKLADISSDAEGNPVLTRPDGSKSTWRL
ncbi:MAG: hypothetical protein VKO21_03775 [Candidatus Sericytochromatia bacterium]|nr:hypothetical protein [Candidatus Sericytochromatia bacterium]